jgi:tetratricopeptide (TPR) repeat protein
MKRVLLILFVLVLVPVVFAQETKRVVVLPFETVGAAEAYRVGLATGLQRALNVVNGVYSPPVGDAFMVFQRQHARNEVSAASVAAAFNASVLVSGRVTPVGNQAEILLGFSGPDYPELKDVTLLGPLDNPRQLLTVITNAVVSELGLRITAEDRTQLDGVYAATPSIPSLQAVGEASLRLPTFNTAALTAAAEIDSGSSWVLSEQARALALAGDEAGAMNVSQRAIDAQPNDIEALVIRANILLAAGNTGTARQAFDVALQLNPSHALALMGKGSLTEDAAQAQALFEAAIASYPRLVDAHLDLASLHAQTNSARALQTLRRGADQIPDSISLRRAVMQQAIRLNDPAGALSYLRQELNNSAANSPILYTLAMHLPRPEYLPQALQIVQEGRAAYPESANLSLAEATLLQEQGDHQAALDLLQEARERNPNNIEVLNQLAILQARQGDLEGARSTLESARGQNDTLQVNLAQIYLQAGQSSAAIETLKPLLQRNPADAELFALYGVALSRAGQVEQARNALDQALQLDPNQQLAQNALKMLEQEQSLTGGQMVEELRGDAATAFSAGRNAIETGNLQQAVQEFSRALEHQDSGLIAFYQAYALQLSGQTRSALAGYERALQDFPDSDVVLNNLGYAYLQLGRYDRALEYLNRAIEANPRNSEAQLNLGLTYYGLGRYANAISAWEQAVSLNPEVQTSIAELMQEARNRAGN